MKIHSSVLLMAVAFIATDVAAQPQPATSSSAQDVPASLRAGKLVYDQHCAACHGAAGDGYGPAAVWVFPKPRNFSAGLFKIQSTPAGSLPSDDDLFQTITRGMPGSSMPSFTYLSEEQRRQSVEYVKHLSAYTDENGKRVNRFDAARAQGEIARPVEVPAEPPVTLDALTKGKELFTKLQCVTCHGETGAGDGPSAATLKDNWGVPLLPRDFNSGAFRGGHTGRDLYLRIHNGMAGTPMPPFGSDVIKPDERWALVLYIQSLRRKDVEISDMLAPQDGAIRAGKVRQLPSQPSDVVWERIEPTRVPLNPLWPEPQPVPAVSVRAVHNGKRVALLLQWRDSRPDGAPVRVQDFQDSAAIQFSQNGTTPFLGMGDANNPVNIWQWKAGLQEAIDSKRPDVNTLYASMHVDYYPETGPLYRTAESAGNIIAKSVASSAVEDCNARGFGTLKAQPDKEQNVQGRGVWFDGHWSVLFTRDLKSKDSSDVKLDPAKAVPVAFAIWNGEQRDRNGRKVVSNWYQLVLEP